MSERLIEALANLEEAKAYEIVKKKLDGGEDPFTILEEANKGMQLIGNRFETGEYFLTDLIFSSAIFKKISMQLEPLLKGKVGREVKGKIVLGTPKGDIHDLGKNIFATLARTAGFEVYDLGVDVPPEKFLDKIKETHANILGMSALISPAFPSMKEVVEKVKQAGLRGSLKIIIGGGVTTPLAREKVGADFQTIYAHKGVMVCKEWMEVK